MAIFKGMAVGAWQVLVPKLLFPVLRWSLGVGFIVVLYKIVAMVCVSTE